MTRTIFTALAAASVISTGAFAQNVGADPTYGSAELEAGFRNDPYSVDLVAGGPVSGMDLGMGCVGSIADAPDFDLYYSAGSFPLTIYAESDADTSLVINTPDGSWVCDDDGGEGLNPSVTFDNPDSGLYDIWVGVLGGGTPSATLNISELGGGGGSSGAPNPMGEPTYGSIELESGFANDPYSVALAAGGSISASQLGDGCIGDIAVDPDFDLYYSAGNLPLYIYATSDSDISLVVNTPDGGWICDDDSGEGLNPSIRLNNPQSGLYDVWVGVLGDGNPSSTLYISELSGQGGAASGAPDPGGAPNYGSVELESGFSGDPYRVSVTAGGSSSASAAASGCIGEVSTNPDFDLYYTAGSLPLYIYATSGEDVSLLVNTPSGDWLCDDDSGNGLNPSLRIGKPESGLYDIWVGSVAGSGNPSAELSISELSAPGLN